MNKELQIATLQSMAIWYGIKKVPNGLRYTARRLWTENPDHPCILIPFH